jgi:phosphoserine aminotransferase
MIYNFSAGPAVMPRAVLKRARGEMLDYRGSGISVMEMSHRSQGFQRIVDEAEAKLRRIMSIPDSYIVLFLQGGASLQFAMVPLNLFKRGSADYVNTGTWSQRAIAEAERYGKVRVVASSEDQGFATIPEIPRENLDPEADYFHFTINNTIRGTRFIDIPDTRGVPLVSDMSSYILSEPFDVSQFGLIYAGAQKNIGPAGLTVIIVQRDLIGGGNKLRPTMCDYAIHASKGSLYNTPPCYSIYMAGLVFDWIEQRGGLEAVAESNHRKADFLFEFLDNSKLFEGTVDKRYRSPINVTFKLPNEELTRLFLEEARRRGMLSLAGHRSVGGLRASLYNAMPFRGVAALVAMMKSFERMHALERQ